MAGKFEIKKSANAVLFNLKARDHEVILTSELYHGKQSVRNGVESVRANALDDGRYERKTAKNGASSTLSFLPTPRRSRRLAMGLCRWSGR